MSINRELSQLASFVSVNDTNRNVGIATTSIPSVGIGTASPTAKFEVVGHTKLETLNVTGVSTLTGVTTTGTDLYVGGDLYVADDLVFDEFNARNGNITGIATIATLYNTYGTITNLTGTAATISRFVNTELISTASTITNISGTAATIARFVNTELISVASTITDLTGTSGTITTFDSTYSTIDNLIGTAATITTLVSSSSTTSDLRVSGLTSTGQLRVSGISTFLNDIDVQATAVVDALTVFPGPTNISGFARLFGNLYVAGITTLAGSGSTTKVGGDFYIGEVGIGTTGGDLYVANNALIAGIVTAAGFEGGPLSGSDGTFTNLSVSGIGTIENLVINNDLDIYAATSTFYNDAIIQGNLTVYGTETSINTQSLNIVDKDIILGIGTTPGNETDNTANGGGIAIASTEGNPVICLQCGVNTLPGTYKQFLWLKEGTFTGLSTDAWISNYAVSIASTIIDYGSRLAVGDIQFTDNDIKTVGNINASGIITSTEINLQNINITGVSTILGGPLFVGSGSSTGTANQLVQVNGGAYISGNLGIGTTNPSKTLHIYTADGDIKIGDITEGTSETDGGVVFTGLGTITSAIFTEVDGSILSYGINCRQITGIETGRVAGIFRLDTRTSGPYGDANCFVVKGRSIGTTTEYNAIVVGLDDGNTYLSPVKGNVGIATTNPTSKLHVIGDVLVTGIITSTDYNSTSDINLKENIQPIENPIDKVMQLNGVSFDWKENGRSSMGVIAQEVEKVLPELVSGSDPKTVNYNGLIGLLVEVVKDQQNRINILEEKLNK